MDSQLFSIRNRLLRMLPAHELDRVLANLEPVPLKAKRVLHHWNQAMEHAWFVETGLISVRARVSHHQSVEAWLIGSEGFTGIPIALGGEWAAPHRRIVQAGGSAWRIRAEDLRRCVKELPRFRKILLLYSQFVLFQSSLTGACNSCHTLRQRLARWLLVALDGLQADHLAITHDLLAQALGVRRASITDSLAALELSGAVSGTRGCIRVLDRGRLEGEACGCSQSIRAGYDRLLPMGTEHFEAAGRAAQIRGDGVTSPRTIDGADRLPPRTPVTASSRSPKSP